MSPGVGRTEAPRPTSSFPSQVVLTTRQRSEFTEMASSPSFEDLPEPALPASEPSAEVATVVEEDWQADGLLGAHPPTDAKHSEKRFSNDIEMGAKKAEDGAKDGAEKAAAAHDDDPPPDGGYVGSPNQRPACTSN